MPSPGKRLIACLLALIGVQVLQSENPPSRPPSALSPILTEVQSKAGTLPVQPFEDFSLRESNPISRRLPRGVTHRYSVALEKDTFLHAWVDQDSVKGKEIDIALLLQGPEGQLFEVDNPMDEFGSEEIFLLADRPGNYRVDVKGFGKEGIYRIRVDTIRPASPADRTNAQAARLFFHTQATYQGSREGADEAVKEYLEAERLWSSVGNQRWQGHALDRAASILADLQRGEQARMLALQTRALNLFRAVGDRRWTARMLVATGISQRQLGKLAQAEVSYRQALEIAEENGYVGEEAESLMNLGLLLGQQGHSLSAVEVLERAHKLWKRRNRIDNQIRTLSYLGISYFTLGKHYLANSRFREAERLLPLQSSDGLWAEVLTRIAEMYGRRKDKENIDLALVYARRALIFRRNKGDLRGEAVTLAGMSLWYRARNDLVRARSAQEDALVIFRRLSDPRNESTAHYNLGLILLDQKDPARALEHFEQGAALAQRQGFQEGKILALYGEALAHRARGNPIAARAAAEEALKLIESGVNVAASDEFENPYLTARLGTHELLMEVLVTSPASYTPEKDKARAFEISEGARWRSLLDEISTEGRSRLLRQPNPALRAEYQRVRAELEIAEQERKRQGSGGPQAGAISSRIAELIERLDTLEIRLRREEEGDPGRSSPATLKEAQALLDDQTVLLEYFLGERRSFLFLVTSTAIEVFELPGRIVIENKAQQLYDQLVLSHLPDPRKEAEKLAQDLGSMLVDPVAPYLGKVKRILVVPDGAIHYVPFIVLPAPPVSGKRKAGGGPLLLDRYEIVYEPSASVLKAIRSERSYRRLPPGFLAAMADAVFSNEYPPLEHSREEAEAILSLVPQGEKTLRAFRHDANLELALSGELGKYRYIHFATHGNNRPEQPALSGIVLSQLDRQGRRRPGDLRLQDIKTLVLPAELVVVSACKTAIGAEIRGEGFVALPQGFMQAGAARVAVSLWNVKDQSTSRFMRRFYKALLVEKQSPAQALRTAQLWMLHETKWKSPYFWAPFEMQGEWR